ncbi:MAG: hypothetical protein KF819_04960 [Labilithrix sp.]|nr:hypothetical protein [Labilithrix sp.]
MKRSTCLSAMLVGLSLMTASVAFGAPSAPPTEEGQPAKPTLVAQAKRGEKPTLKLVQPTDPAPAEGGSAPAAPTEPAAAPASSDPAPAVETTQPAISLGSAAAPSDSPSAAPEEPKAKPKPRPWAGTNIFAMTSMTTATAFAGQQQDYNPMVDMSIWLMPRYAINDAFQLRLLSIFFYEFTNGDFTQTRNEPRFSDTTLGLWYRKIPEIPGVGIKPMVALNLGAPTSPESRARTLIVNPGATLQLVKGFEHVLGGEVLMIGNMTYSHPIYRYSTPERRGEMPYQPLCGGASLNCGSQLLGLTNPSDQLIYGITVVGEWGKFSPAFAYRGTSQWAYQPGNNEQTVQVAGQNVPVESAPGFQPTNVRQLSYFSFWLDYMANAWFTAEVGYWMSRPILNEDGTFGNPFFSRYQDMRVYLGFNFAIDSIMKALEGGATDAGIVRAQNKQPMWNF